ncbi:N-acetylmuramoyl-L-alanine amidase [Clostridium botulinum]|nr:N-acetylmuramoyl-L-alanine amidase [Clostridium botulinum]NFO40923.1 N-acetylmuramoyl-L-alanine amidase [Clostridium botulinum]
MKIGLRGGHSKKCIGAVGIVNEYEQMQKFYSHVSKLLTKYGHTIVDCNSNVPTSSAELAEGVRKANNADVDLFISLHMNAYDGNANGTECYVSSTSSRSYKCAKKICDNFVSLGFKNRGVKVKSYYEMKNIKAPNIIFEICFCDSKKDIDIYNKYSWEQLTYKLCNAIDNSIPNEPVEAKKSYVVTKYLPCAYDGYDGVDIRKVLEYFDGVKCYVRGDSKGVWIETEYLNMDKCRDLKNVLGEWFYEVKK